MLGDQDLYTGKDRRYRVLGDGKSWESTKPRLQMLDGQSLYTYEDRKYVVLGDGKSFTAKQGTEYLSDLGIQFRESYIEARDLLLISKICGRG